MSDDAARVEAERRWPFRYPNGDWANAGVKHDAFVAGAAWQAAQPVVVTAEQVEAAARAICEGISLIPWEEHDAREAWRETARDVLNASLGITAVPTPPDEDEDYHFENLIGGY